MSSAPTFITAPHTFLSAFTPHQAHGNPLLRTETSHNRHASRSPLRRMRLPARRPIIAVLDLPSSANPYLQAQSASTIRDYLTRRAVHTVLYYFMELGDAPSKQWLLAFENFAAQERADSFQDGDAFLRRMLHARSEKGRFVQRHPRGYFSRTFNFIIEPFRIAHSVLAARKQLAGEWGTDLMCVEAENLEIQRMAFERLLESDSGKLDAKRNLVFDYDNGNANQTPLRYKNYKALIVLVTQHAIARLMPYLRDTSNHEYMFMIQYVSSYGALKDGDHFVRTLMEQPLQERTNPAFVIDPRALAMHVMDLRRVVAEEWIDVMGKVPKEQLTFNRSILEHSVEISDAMGEDARSSSPSSSRRDQSTPIHPELDDVDDIDSVSS